MKLTKQRRTALNKVVKAAMPGPISAAEIARQSGVSDPTAKTALTKFGFTQERRGIWTVQTGPASSSVELPSEAAEPVVDADSPTDPPAEAAEAQVAATSSEGSRNTLDVSAAPTAGNARVPNLDELVLVAPTPAAPTPIAAHARTPAPMEAPPVAVTPTQVAGSPSGPEREFADDYNSWTVAVPADLRAMAEQWGLKIEVRVWRE